jgi:RHS repeat-associated protein
MPDRYVSDTSSKCMTLTQSRWVTTWVDSCYNLSDLIWKQDTTGGAIAVGTTGNGMEIDAPRVNSSVSFALDVEPAVEQLLTFEIASLTAGTGSMIAVEESIDGQWKTLNSVPLDTRGNIRLPFVSLLGNVRVSVTGPTQTVLNRICRKKPIQYQESYLTQVCNGDKDRYRFGFNGMEKDNEMKGVGNSLDFGARMYDSRVGRWLSLDPLATKYPFATPYNFSLNTPIQAKDPDGNVVIFINGQHTGSGGKSDYWRVFKDIKVGVRSERDGFGRMKTSDIFANREVYAFDKAVMDRIGDHKSLYKDGAMGGFKNTLTSEDNLDAGKRIISGLVQGLIDAKEIIAKLERDKEGKINESIKIVTHSMGGAYGKGYSAGILSYAEKNNIKNVEIEFEVDFAPFQPNKLKAIPGIRTIQVSHKYDKVVNNVIKIAGSEEAKQEGVSDTDYHLNTNDKNKGHSLTSFGDEINNVVPQSKNNSNTK